METVSDNGSGSEPDVGVVVDVVECAAVVHQKYNKPVCVLCLVHSHSLIDPW